MTHTARTLQEAFGYLFAEEVDALQNLVRSLPGAPTVLQIGAGAGTSSLAMLEARSDVSLTTVDIQAGNSPFGCLYAEKQVVTEAGMADRLSQIHGSSITVGREWGGPKFDMVFIDGDHSYEGCKGDILAWTPHLKRGGILAVHDYNKADAFENVTGKAPHPKVWDGVDLAVNELLMGFYPQVLFVRSLIAFRVE
jgi:predicted O-methyltransferase YrrM